MREIGYKKAEGILYEGALKEIKKKDDEYLQFLFEAFTNSLESIETLKDRYPVYDKGEITIRFFYTKNLMSTEDGSVIFDKIEVEDSGIGFEDIEFERFCTLRDYRKGFSNKGTGRIQYTHSFKHTFFESTYRDKKNADFISFKMTLSKTKAFIDKNAIIRVDECKVSDKIKSQTKVTFVDPNYEIEKKRFESLTIEEVKERILNHYIARFCKKRDTLPEINIIRYVDDAIDNKVCITQNDIPTPCREEDFEVNYSRLNGKNITKLDKQESFNLKSFVVPDHNLSSNNLKLVSKGEIACDINLDGLLPKDTIKGNRYLFLLSGDYIDARDNDTRGNINISSKKDFKAKAKNEDTLSMYPIEEILLEDMEEKANTVIASLHKEIQEKLEEKAEHIKELEEMFLLNPETIDALKGKIKIGDSDDSILNKVYKAEATLAANKDAEMKKKIKDLELLDPSNSANYQEKLCEQVNDFVRDIPVQNRTSLTQYVARRKLVLDLFGKVLKQETKKLKGGGRINEKLLHNLIFQQHSDDPMNSDLWLINEEFIYFKGNSEPKLNKMKIDGKDVFKKEFEGKAKEHLSSFGEDRLSKRPDVLLLPSEGKCIIIEFKAPDVNASEHLNQINSYASLIRNYTEDEFQITTFYGYLIGENIEDRDVRGAVSSFEHSYHFNYWFDPSKKVVGYGGRSDGSIYTEVLTYSSLLERAIQRNKIFIEKITN